MPSDQLTAASRIIVIVAGTKDVERPLLHVLRRRLCAPVLLIRPEVLDRKLADLGGTSAEGIWLVPSNELSLNKAHAAVERAGGVYPSTKFHIAGTATIGRTIHAAELSNKTCLIKLMERIQPYEFKTVETRLNYWTPKLSDPVATDGLRFPLVLKPAQKDAMDSFTAAFPRKVLLIRDRGHLGRIVSQHGSSFVAREFLIQEAVPGPTISWFGAVSRGRVLCGHGIIAEVKSPAGFIGGTTTLARIEVTDSHLQRAVAELAGLLGLDGLFEIEFIRSGGQLFFFHEINPRPILQASLSLCRPDSPFVSYFLAQRFPVSFRAVPVRAPTHWGSATRYLRLELAGGRFSVATLLRIVRHDVGFGVFFTPLERLRSLLRITLMTVRAYGSLLLIKFRNVR